MLRRLVLSVLLAAAPAIAHSAGAATDATPRLEVTYVANEGFLVEAGGKKIAVDAFFAGDSIDWCDAPSPETVKEMRSASGPFEGIDLVLVTHAHVDHFTPDLVLAHLKANPRAALVAPKQAVTKLRAGEGWAEDLQPRIHEVDLALFGSKELAFDGLRVEAHRIRHGFYPIKDETTGQTRDKHADVENIAYVVEAGGASFAHFGDALLDEDAEYFEGERFAARHVDAAFLEGWSDSILDVLAKAFDPATVVAMHLPAEADRKEKIEALLRSKIPAAVCFHRMLERRGLPVRGEGDAKRGTVSAAAPKR